MPVADLAQGIWRLIAQKAHAKSSQFLCLSWGLKQEWVIRQLLHHLLKALLTAEVFFLKRLPGITECHGKSIGVIEYGLA
jgi:hypothetical protein